MSSTVRLGVIGGNGWLGNAIADAAVSTGLIDPSLLTLSTRSGGRGLAEIPGAYWTKDNVDLTNRSDVIILSVRPEQFPAVQIDARGKLIISVMAAMPAHRISLQTNSDRVIRSMPNGAVSIRQSFTPWFATPPVSRTDKEVVRALFTTCGDTEEVETESQLDYCAGLTGSGAAFPALLAEAMINHAEAQGLPRAFARRAVGGVIIGATQLFEFRRGGSNADAPGPNGLSRHNGRGLSGNERTRFRRGGSCWSRGGGTQGYGNGEAVNPAFSE
jgi:pyrroline-5-carboxylate reductase